MQYAFRKGQEYVYEYVFDIQIEGIHVTVEGTKTLSLADSPHSEIPASLRQPGNLELDYRITSRQLIDGQEVDEGSRQVVESTMIMQPNGQVLHDLSRQSDFLPLLSNTPGELFLEFLGDGNEQEWDQSRVIVLDKLGPDQSGIARFRLDNNYLVESEIEQGVRIRKNLMLQNQPSAEVPGKSSSPAFELRLRMSGIVFYERERRMVTSIRHERSGDGNRSPFTNQFRMQAGSTRMIREGVGSDMAAVDR